MEETTTYNAIHSIPNSYAFSKNLTSLRRQLGMSPEEVAVKLGMTRPGYNKYESGKVKNITQKILVSIAGALSVDVSALITLPKQVHNDEVSKWIETEQSQQWVTMAYYQYLKHTRK